MPLRPFLRLPAIGLVLLGSLAPAAAAPAPEAPPNVLFIAVDDLNDWIGALGHPLAQTPHLDRLAAEGQLFELAMCPTPLCNPSRTAILTGLRANTTGIYENNHFFRDFAPYADWVTLPQYFRAHGYTARAGGKVFHKASGKAADPASWDEIYHPATGTPAPPLEARWQHGLKGKFVLDYYNQALDWAPLDLPLEETQDWITADRAARFLAQEHDQPFFLAAGFFRPHLPWYAPREFFERYPLAAIEVPRTIPADLADTGPIGQRMAGGQAHAVISSHGQWREAVRAYLACITYVDTCIGHLLDALAASPHADNTIVVLWSDHGFHLGEKQHWEKYTLWERANRSVLMLKAPGVTTAGARCARPVNLIDLHATLLELCGLPPREEIEGRSLVPLLHDPEQAWAPTFMTHYPRNHAVRDERYRYIRYADGFEELYDHTIDPEEWTNRAADPALRAVKDRLATFLPDHNADWPDYPRSFNQH